MARPRRRRGRRVVCALARFARRGGGSVVAADIDTQLIEDLAAPNFEIRQMDLSTDELEVGAFDFVHTRLLPIHAPAREEVLRRLVDDDLT